MSDGETAGPGETRAAGSGSGGAGRDAAPEHDMLGPYRLGEVLGVGGMGVVYRAHHTELDRKVALKLITPELASDEDFRRRFERESRLAASIEHQNVIPVYDAGEIDGRVFISMRLVEGRDLSAALEGGALSPEMAADVISQVASALDAAHAAGLVHRDVKPGNIVLDESGGKPVAYLTDFGLTKHVSSKTQLTESGQFVGTVDYIAPEQARAEPVDARTDVYSLAAVLYQALAGEVPFPRDSTVATLMAHLTDPVPDVSRQKNANVPKAFDDVIRRGMAKEPENRFPSAGDLGRAAQAAAAGERLPRAERSVARGDAAAPRRRRRTPILLGVLAILVVAGLAALAVTQLGSDDPAGQITTDTEGDGGTTGGGGAEPQTQRPLVVRANTTGPQSVGEFQPQFHGLAVAKELFGQPTSTQPGGGETCVVSWDDPGILVMFANFGGNDACTAQGSLTQYYGVGGDFPDAERWETAEGLAVGDSLARLKSLYPGTHVTPDPSEEVNPPGTEDDRAWALVEVPSPFGEGASLTYLAALESDGEITAFTGYVGGAGE